MSCDISAFEFEGVEVIVSQKAWDRHEKKVLLLVSDTWEEPVTVFKRAFARVSAIFKDLTFFCSIYCLHRFKYILLE